MDFSEKLAVESGYRSIRLDAFKKNPIAIKFYQDLEYFPAGSVQFRKDRFICFEKAPQ